MNCQDAGITAGVYMALSILELIAVYSVGVFLEFHVLQKYETFKSGLYLLHTICSYNQHCIVIPYKPKIHTALMWYFPLIAFIDFIVHALHTVYGWDWISLIMVGFDSLFWGTGGEIFHKCSFKAKVSIC